MGFWMFGWKKFFRVGGSPKADIPKTKSIPPFAGSNPLQGSVTAAAAAARPQPVPPQPPTIATPNRPRPWYGSIETRRLHRPLPQPVTSKPMYASIHEAAKYGHLDSIKSLLKEDPGLVNRIDETRDSRQGFGWDWTPLHYAAWHGQKDAAELLLANGANVNARVRTDGCRHDTDSTPLHFAARHGYKGVAELLLANKADVNARAVGGMPLHHAANGGHKAIVELLLANGADVNAKDLGGTTPLQPAVKNGHKGVVELLLLNKADVNVKSKEYGRPLLYAKMFGTEEMVELLRQHGAHENGTGT
jgi:ankyrin repeat protein